MFEHGLRSSHFVFIFFGWVYCFRVGERMVCGRSVGFSDRDVLGFFIFGVGFLCFRGRCLVDIGIQVGYLRSGGCLLLFFGGCRFNFQGVATAISHRARFLSRVVGSVACRFRLGRRGFMVLRPLGMQWASNTLAGRRFHVLWWASAALARGGIFV